jgi:hypothetical protein
MSRKQCSLYLAALWCGCLLISNDCVVNAYSDGASEGNRKEEDNDAPLVSSVHCVGETFLPDAWMYRSCRFWNVCWKHSNMETFTLFPSAEELELQKAIHDLPLLPDVKMTDEKGRTTTSTATRTAAAASSLVTISSSSILPPSAPYVSLQSIYNNQQAGTPWFPNTTAAWESFATKSSLPSATQIQRLPATTVVVPIVWSKIDVSKRWKDYFAVYTLLTMFGLDDDKNQVMILDVQDGTETVPMPAYLERWQSVLFAPNLRSMTIDPNSIVCASNAVAGLGRIAATFHDETLDDNDSRNVFLSHSIFRGIGIFEFRSYLLRRLGMSEETATDTGAARCVCTVTATSCRVCTDVERLFVPTTKFPVRHLGATIKIDEATVSLPQIAATAIKSKALLVDGACPFLLPLATFLPRDATLVVIGPTPERSFLMTWTHLHISFVESAAGALSE